MPTSPPLHERLPLSHSSANNNFRCSSVKNYDKKAENAMKKSLKRHLHRGHAFLRKSLQKPIIVQAHKTGRRRYTFSGYQDSKLVYKKRRRFTSIACPTKFLLGGTRTDPLNLKSLDDEEVNQQLNAFSPASSPMPIPPWRSQVKVVIPPNIYDPLNLNSGEEIRFDLLSKSRKRRRHRKSRREEHEIFIENKELVQTDDASSVDQEKQLPDINSPSNTKENDSEVNKELLLPTEEANDKVESISVDNSSEKLTVDTLKELEENVSVERPVLKRRRSKTRIQKADTKRFRANAEKFCYGNHLISHRSWNFYGHNEDPRIGFLTEDLFHGKKVLDIGCNSGDLTLFIAKNFHPQCVTALDIDKKMVNIAQRRLRRETENCLGVNAPRSLAVLYGSLAKVLQMIPRELDVFPRNVTFLEANYVPPSEDYLETQKPEYDTILCLRVTKWIHLNFGDEGLKLVFKRMYAQLRMGGHLILEPQPWFTYSSSKRITPAIYKTYCSLQMRPESFCDYLLSSEVGFGTCELLGRSINYAKGYRQNIYLLTKPYESASKGLLNSGLSPIPFHDDQWTSNEHNYDATLDCMDASSEYSDTNIQM